nr:PREDICTED: uncharacterized protein LOC105671240 [Linepithema humile]
MVKPIEKSCGVCIKQKFDSKFKMYKTVPLTCTFTYVPIIETLKFLFKNNSFKKIIFNSFNKKTLNCSTYNNLVDGEMYKTNNLFHNSEKLTIEIEIFFDDFEICNPLGSKALSHKIGGFYFVICNLPPHFNSNLNNIHLLTLCYSKYIKDFGINSVLEVIVKDLRILETEGFYIEGVEYPIKGTLATLSHDNLGGATLYGMVESFQANFFCRICLMHKNFTKINCKQEDILLRTPENFKNHIQLAINHYDDSVYGIKLRSALNDLEFFKFGINLSVDIMHDFLEGICQLELKLFLKFLIQEKLTSIEEINDKINTFDYGLQNRANKPSLIYLNKAGHLIGQRAAQTYCLLIFFPLIISDITKKLDHSTNYNKWKVILLLIEIVKIAFAPILHNIFMTDFENLIENHHKLFLTEYNTHLRPKHHMITHLPTVIKRMGPPRHFWTMRFESKHNYLKDLSNKLKNFKNVCKTLAFRHQQDMLFKWNNCNIFELFPFLKKCNVTAIGSTTYFNVISKFLNLKI